MKKKSPIKKHIITLLFVMLIMFPVIIKSTHHHSEDGNHKKCNNKVSYTHKISVDFCDICFFSIASFNHIFSKTNNFRIFISNTKIPKSEYSFKVSTFAFTIKQLRAPPLFIS